KVNSTHKGAACRSCIKANPNKPIEDLYFTNKKETCLNHLKHCKHFKEEIDADDNNSNIKQIKKVNSGKLTNYINKATVKNKQEKFIKSIFNATISNGWAFRWVEDTNIKEAFCIANSTLKLPSRKQLSGKILSEKSKEIKDDLYKSAKSDKLGITLTFDGWKNVVHQKLLGVVLINSCGKNLIWDVKDISGDLQNWNVVYKYATDLFEELRTQEIKILSLVTDSASENVAARKRLRKKYREITFLPCFAHQLNLIMGDVFKSSNAFKETSTLAKICYQKYWALVQPNDTRWCSHYYCFKSLVRSKIPLKTLVNKNSLSDDHEARNLSEEMVNIIESEGWWRNLEQLTILLHPISAILNQLQKYTAKLYDIMHGFAYIMKIYKKVLAMSQIKAKLIFEQKIKELQKFFDHYHSESALPFEESGITMPENLISSWVEMTEEEEFDILEDNSSNSNNFIDFHEISNNSPLSDPNILQRTYPADDQNAKWKMENLFVEDLEPPFLL
ncbi:1510_t:CDS:2, partial [Entrophospora sp. SA101]